MSDTTPVRAWSRRRKVTIVALTLVLILGLGVVVGAVWWRSQRQPMGGLFGFFSVMQEATGGLMDGTAVSAQFVNELRAQRWHEAYRYTSRGFQQRVDEASFERFVKDSPALKGTSTPINFNLLLASPGASITFSGAPPAPKGGLWVLLIGEDGTLKIDRMSLEDKSVP